MCALSEIAAKNGWKMTDPYYVPHTPHSRTHTHTLKHTNVHTETHALSTRWSTVIKIAAVDTKHSPVHFVPSFPLGASHTVRVHLTIHSHTTTTAGSDEPTVCRRLFLIIFLKANKNPQFRRYPPTEWLLSVPCRSPVGGLHLLPVGSSFVHA